MSTTANPVTTFIQAACVPPDQGHGSGTLESARAILATHPETATVNIYAAAILADEVTVRRFLAQDPGLATAKGGPHDWDALTHLCFSRYLRLDPSRSDDFARTAKALLDAGASPNTGWWEKSHQPNPGWEGVLYGAAGIAQHPGLTRLLVERGADPNDGEVTYHTPETDNNAVLKILVESGKLTADSLATMLLRKADWHDYEGIKYLLAHGADPNRQTHWSFSALHQALRRDNSLEIITAMLDHGGDPTLKSPKENVSTAFIAAHRGRRDALELFAQRGFFLAWHGIEKLLAACALNDSAEIQSFVAQEPGLVRESLARGGAMLAEFASNGNAEGVRQLLDLGVSVNAPYHQGDGYFGIAKNSTALHVAAWRARPAVVKLLLERGATVNAVDGAGRTPLMLAVRACVDSHWMQRRSPEAVAALLQAGATLDGVTFPCGYAEVDQLLEARRAQDAKQN